MSNSLSSGSVVTFRSIRDVLSTACLNMGEHLTNTADMCMVNGLT